MNGSVINARGSQTCLTKVPHDIRHPNPVKSCILHTVIPFCCIMEHIVNTKTGKENDVVLRRGRRNYIQNEPKHLTMHNAFTGERCFVRCRLGESLSVLYCMCLVALLKATFGNGFLVFKKKKMIHTNLYIWVNYTTVTNIRILSQQMQLLNTWRVFFVNITFYLIQEWVNQHVLHSTLENNIENNWLLLVHVSSKGFIIYPGSL